MEFTHRLARRLARLRGAGLTIPFALAVACNDTTSSDHLGPADPTSPNSGASAGMEISPQTAVLARSATQAFQIAGGGADSSVPPVAVKWTATGGTIDSAGLYTAPDSVGTYQVIATNPQGVVDSATVTVDPSASMVTAAVTQAARPADAVADAFGVNVHLIYTTSVYYKRYSDVIKPRLRELGVRHLRDVSLKPTDGQAGVMTSRLRELATQGTKSLLIFDWRYCTAVQCKAFVKNLGPGVVEAIEGWNEPDRRFSRTDLRWVNDSLKPYVKATWSAMKGDPATASIPVGSPSIEFGATAQAIGDISSWVNFASIHPYPTWPYYPTYSDRVKSYVSVMSPAYSNRSWWTTESGYHTGASCSDRPVSEPVHGKYLPRMLLEYVLRNQKRVYNYELIDQGTPSCNREKSFGLLRMDGSAKPAFTAMKNLLAITKDPGTSFTPGTLAYGFPNAPTSLHHLLLQKRDGRFYIALWLEVSSSTSAVSKPVTLSLSTRRSVNRYTPSTSATATSLGTGTSFNVTATDAVTLLEIK